MTLRIEVLKPGAQSQLQDLGRHGHQHLGVPVCGAMDEWSQRLANLLVGNDEQAATLEIVLTGPSLRFHGPAQIALCGADLSARLDGTPLPLHCRVDLPAGALLEFGPRASGLRVYLALRGGFAAPLVMGSRSTFVRGGFGGLEGRALRRGDVLTVAQPLPALPPASTAAAPELTLPRPALAGEDGSLLLRVIPGEHWALFTPAAQVLLSQARYRISPQSDRMGYRLEGPPLQRELGGELISEGVAFGAIQVPADGQPIVLMAERQSTGGYAKIAHVASVDLPLLAQAAPQQWLRFAPIALETAQTLYLEREHRLAALRQQLAPDTPFTP